MSAYQSPGVYRQEAFLKPKPVLPTGVPAFVGFADEAGAGSGETRVALESLPEGLVFPDALTAELQKYISYDGSGKQLVCNGIMTTSGYHELWNLSAADAFRKAVKGLYQKTQQALNQPVALHRKEEFAINFASLPPEKSFLADAVNGFFDNGGVSCYVVHADPTEEAKEALVAALKSLAPLDDLDLVAVPDAMTLEVQDAEFVQQAALAHCAEQADRFAILDAARVDSRSPDAVSELSAQAAALIAGLAEPVSGALYYPWITITSGTTVRTIPPCGHVAGIYARTDGKAGVHKAPANEELRGVIDLDSPIDNKIQDQLNPRNINCLRAFPGRGIRVWGARTLSREENWKYVNVRRLVLTLRRWIDANMTWAAFEPNTPRLWIRIQRELGGRLNKLWQVGALKGQTSGEAYYVKCDAETNPADAREAGQVVTEIGLAPSIPAEFIVVRITHRAGTTELD